MSVEKFEKLKLAMNEAVVDYGFIENEGRSKKGTMITEKTKLANNSYQTLHGSDAKMSIAVCNEKKYVRIIINDWSYNHETEFLSKLKQTIISKLKEKLWFSDVVFNETGVFFFNN